MNLRLPATILRLYRQNGSHYHEDQVYWTVIQGRYLNDPDLIRCRHRIKAV